MALQLFTEGCVDRHRLQVKTRRIAATIRETVVIDYWTFGGESGTAYMIVDEAYLYSSVGSLIRNIDLKKKKKGK